MSQQRKIYQSENGDSWWLCRDGSGVFVLHEASVASGGTVTRVELAKMLRNTSNGPEKQALLEMIGGLTAMVD
jgi:hypothetical protein